MNTTLTRQVLTILAKDKKPVYLKTIFEAQTVTKHQARLGILLRELCDQRLIDNVNSIDDFYTQYQITAMGLEYYNNEVKAA